MTRSHQVGLIRALPLHQEQELSGGIGGADDPLSLEATIKPADPLDFFRMPGTVLLAALLGLPLFQLLFEVLDQGRTIEVLLGLPSVLVLAVALPVDEVLNHTVANPLVHQFLD